MNEVTKPVAMARYCSGAMAMGCEDGIAAGRKRIAHLHSLGEAPGQMVALNVSRDWKNHDKLTIYFSQSYETGLGTLSPI